MMAHNFEDALIKLTDGQESALAAYDEAIRQNDDAAVQSIKYHINAWDKHFGRTCSIYMRDKKRAALKMWEHCIFENGGGI